MKRLVTVVAGAGPGTGAAICRRLAEDGHDVVVGYTGDADVAEEAAEGVRRSGARALCVQADTSVSADVERLFTSAEKQLGPVTGLVNNGLMNNAELVGPSAHLADTDPADLRRFIEVNLLGPLLCSRRAARGMTPRGNGVIVNVIPCTATPDAPVHQAMTNAAVEALTLTLAKELGPGIRVNAVEPGNTEEVAAAIAWLMSPDASYVRGTVIRGTGGR
ncbi:SDR family oxidoreductase [Streptomyces sp. NBC_01239]|uniref:SDR family NAD(P)-dependent oxidoreductase n=1 Tax=Streptomyces sp. NBC_01239 TaxID=2903792 RepID=UPI002251D710|nr:SDR family oxidoreductase [Streptomyces sp. NBC_01239]MCX4809495.1 SDR family oxidoreductase [Streptomyces sp. NBC_01239]